MGLRVDDRLRGCCLPRVTPESARTTNLRAAPVRLSVRWSFRCSWASGRCTTRSPLPSATERPRAQPPKLLRRPPSPRASAQVAGRALPKPTLRRANFALARRVGRRHPCGWLVPVGAEFLRYVERTRLLIDNSNGADARFASDLQAALTAAGFEVELREPSPRALYDTSVHFVVEGVAIRLQDDPRQHAAALARVDRHVSEAPMLAGAGVPPSRARSSR